MSYYTFLIGLSGVLVLSIGLLIWDLILVFRLRIDPNFKRYGRFIMLSNAAGIAFCFMLLAFCRSLFLILKEIDPAGVL